jgi:hypothetical protein
MRGGNSTESSNPTEASRKNSPTTGLWPGSSLRLPDRDFRSVEVIDSSGSRFGCEFDAGGREDLTLPLHDVLSDAEKTIRPEIRRLRSRMMP